MLRLLVFLAFAFAAGAFANDDPVVFKSDVALTRVDTQVLDKDGRAVTGLQAEDFVLRVNGKVLPVRNFASENMPIDILLLLDVSGSVRKYLRDIAAIAGSALAQLQKNDQLAVMLFSRNTWIEQAFTDDHEAISDAIRKAGSEDPPGSGTRIYAAVQNASRYLQDQPQESLRRRAILTVTDNDSMSYDVHKDQALRALFDRGITFDAIVVGPHPHPPEPRNGAAVNPNFAFDDVFPLAQETGGEVLATNKPKENLSEMLGRLRERYLLVYSAPAGIPPNSFRHVRVELAPAARSRHPRAAVHTRGGYYVSGPA